MEHPTHLETKAGTFCGTLLSIAVNLGGEILRTALFAMIGATVSFFVSLLLRRMVERWNLRKKSR